jgi:hypothetical protein
MTATNAIPGPKNDTANDSARKSHFACTGLPNESVVAWLEGLCDEHNAPVRRDF